MIPMLVGERPAEAERIHNGLMAAGIAAQLVADPRAVTVGSEGVTLVQADALLNLSQAPVSGTIIAFGGEDRAHTALACLRQGASEYLLEGAAIDLVSSTIDACKKPHLEHSIIADSPRMLELVELAERVALADIAVMISGESGTGKEVIARHIHNASNRHQGPFVAVNCAAIPETMLEAVLFGHDKGAFTGATEKRLGKFELADGGTLLLDEITEMPTALQAKLLRVLQEQEVERIGSNKPKKVDVRVVATSNRDLKTAVSEGVLREDLYYRLSVFPLHLAPLRERKEDILALANFFLRKHSHRTTVPVVLEDTQLALELYSWPGNVRELENTMQRALVMSSGNSISTQHLGLVDSKVTAAPAPESLHAQMQCSEEELLLQTLAINNGVRKSTAAQLGISERTLRHKLKQLRDRGVLV